MSALYNMITRRTYNVSVVNFRQLITNKKQTTKAHKRRDPRQKHYKCGMLI